MKTFISDISKKEFSAGERISAKTVRPSILSTIQRDHPEFDQSCHLAVSELNQFRQKYIGDYLLREIGELSDLEKTVLRALKNRSTLTDKIEDDEPEKFTLGQRLADKVASFGGSWRFISLFMFFLLAWIIMNAFFLMNKSFDPYPFILLNLILYFQD